MCNYIKCQANTDGFEFNLNPILFEVGLKLLSMCPTCVLEISIQTIKRAWSFKFVKYPTQFAVLVGANLQVDTMELILLIPTKHVDQKLYMIICPVTSSY